MTWLRCDAMLRLNRRQRELLLGHIGGQLNSAQIAAKIGCTENTIKLIRAARQRHLKIERNRAAHERHVATLQPRAQRDAGEWPKVDGGDFLEALVAAYGPKIPAYRASSP